jgi:hypothetical protein
VSDEPADRNWRQRKYDEVFEQTCAQVELRRRHDPSFSLEQLEGILRTAYVDEGNDWVGRGAVQDIVLSATIAAYEHVLAEWRHRRGSPDAGAAD